MIYHNIGEFLLGRFFTKIYTIKKKNQTFICLNVYGLFYLKWKEKVDKVFREKQNIRSSSQNQQH
jgi:hypothetical protein